MTSLTREPSTRTEDVVDCDLAVQGDRAAFERIYRRHLPRIHSLARRMASAESADELTQDIFVRAWQKLGSFRREAAFGTWLYRLGINVILAHRSSAAVRRERFLDEEVAPPDRPASAARPDLRVDLEAAIATLPEGARRVFVLHDVEGYKHEEIARLLDVTPGTSKSQLHRARMLLRSYLTR